MSCTRQLLYFNFISINSLIFYLGFHFRYHVVYAGDCVPNRVTFTHDFRVKYFAWKYFCVFNDRHYLPHCPMNAKKENEREHECDSLFYRESKHSNGSFSNVIQFNSACTSILYTVLRMYDVCIHVQRHWHFSILNAVLMTPSCCFFSSSSSSLHQLICIHTHSFCLWTCTR